MARILFVAGEGPARSETALALRRLTSHEISEAANGAAALEAVGRKPFDLVLLDVVLTGIDGFEVCRRIRNEPRTADVLVVFVTAAHGHVENRLRGLDLGAADFIVEPIDQLELVARIGSVLRSKSLADEVRRHNIELGEKVVERTRQLEELASELRIERDALRETFDLFEEALLLLDGAGRIQMGNAAGRKLLDDPAVDESVQGALRELAGQAIGTGAVCDRSVSHSGRQLQARAYPAAGRRALLYVRDITEQRDEEVRRLQSEKLASIGMLAAGVAHEINNPASFVLANMDALGTLLGALRERLDGDPRLFEAMTILQESKEGMARIYRIVRDLHSFSRVDDEPTATSDINAAIESALTMLRNELRYRTVVERELHAEQPVRVSAARLGQVFLNLIINAAHALPEGNLKGNRLKVRSRDDGPFVVVEIEDNGPGIPIEVMPRIFESFFTTKPAGVGTGLGLAISREIIRSVGGELEAESQPGKGALFRVKVPALEGARPDEVTPTPLPMVRRRRRLLAVDDEALLLKAYRRMLSEHHDVETRVGAREALALFESDRHFDVVLCDLQMPEVSGAELYASVKTQWPELAERFVFITGGAFSPEARRFLDETAVARIHKPVHVAELLELIERRAARA